MFIRRGGINNYTNEGNGQYLVTLVWATVLEVQENSASEYFQIQEAIQVLQYSLNLRHLRLQTALTHMYRIHS